MADLGLSAMRGAAPTDGSTGVRSPHRHVPCRAAAWLSASVWGRSSRPWCSRPSLRTAPGQITEFHLPRGSAPLEITTGADGNLWFTDVGWGLLRTRIAGQSWIGRITPSGQITEFSLPARQYLESISPLDLDGNIWFTARRWNRIGRITPSGQITEFQVPGAERELGSIVAGSDGNLWFADTEQDRPHHPERADHRLPASCASILGRSHRWPRRQPLVQHRRYHRPEQDRPHHPERTDHRVPNQRSTRSAEGRFGWNSHRATTALLQGHRSSPHGTTGCAPEQADGFGCASPNWAYSVLHSLPGFAVNTASASLKGGKGASGEVGLEEYPVGRRVHQRR